MKRNVNHEVTIQYSITQNGKRSELNRYKLNTLHTIF